MTAILVFAVVLGICTIGGKLVVDKVTEKVIKEMRREYSPGPYNPGFDPDKVDPNFFKNQQAPPPSRSNYVTPSDFNSVWDFN